MCTICDGMGMAAAECRSCGEFFMWTRWDVETYGSPSTGAVVGAAGDEPDNAIASPTWIHQNFDPRSCWSCKPDGYRYPVQWANNPEGNAWLAGGK